MCCDAFEETSWIGYLEGHSQDWALALRLIWRIACAKKYTQYLIPGYGCVVESKHASNMETMKSKSES